jgi:hypothetical protein
VDKEGIGALYRCGRASNRAGDRWIECRGCHHCREISARDFWPKEGDDSWGLLSVRQEGSEVTGSGFCLAGPWASSGSRPNGLPRPFSNFNAFSFSLFL